MIDGSEGVAEARWSTAIPSLPSILLLVSPLLFGVIWLSGYTFYWGDLTYIHHPWRALAAEEIVAGRLPLWNPFVYLGMPLAAQMQGGAWYPGSAPFYLFPFEGALAFFHAAHFSLIAVFAYLWLRRGGLAGTAALGGALVMTGCGILVSRVQFLNHLSTLAYAPALLLFSGQPWLLALTAAMAFLSGYPLMLAGAAGAAYVLSWILERRAPPVLGWLAAVALAAGLGAVLLAPAAQLAAGSTRGAGLPAAEVLEYGLSLKDLGGLIAPWLAVGRSSAAADWWRACWFGVAATLAACAALPRLRPRAALGLGAYIALVLILALGGDTRLGRALWLGAPALRYIRYPGNLTYLLVPAVAALAAAGLAGRRRAGVWVGAILLELLAYALVSQPVIRRGYYTSAGTLARRLQSGPGSHRYLLSPRALEWSWGFGRGAGDEVLDFKHRLYGLANAPYRLASVGNFGEPLVPRPCYDVMDFLYRRSGLPDVAPYLPWVDAPVLLTRERLPAGPLRYLGQDEWHAYGTAEPTSRALWLSAEDGERLPEGLSPAAEMPALSRSKPLAFERGASSAFSVSGETGAGWAYVSEPLLPGWRVWLDGKPVRPERAWRAFQKLRVPAGRWRLVWRYAPATFAFGLALTVAFLCASAAYWYNRLASALP